MADEPIRSPLRWALVCLAVSVVLNLFLAGVLVGRTFTPPGAAPPAASRMGSGFALRLRSLPPEERREVGLAFQRRRPQIRAARLALQAAGEAARAAMKAEPYDAARLEAAFTRVRAASNDLQAVLQGAVTEGLASLPASSRAALATPPSRP